MIRLELLGKPIIRNGQREAKLYAKAVALLAYLALEGRTSRRKIAELLWTGAPDALNNLSVTRGHILSELGEGALESDLETLALGKDVQVDVHDWLELSATPERFDMYKGEFLAGIHFREWKKGFGLEFEEWLEEKRQQYSSEQNSLAFNLAKTALKQKNYSNAIPWLELASLDPFEPREEAARWLMLAYGAKSEIDKVVHIYQKLCTLLGDALGVEPTALTRSIFEVARTDRHACLEALKQEMGGQIEKINRQPKSPFVGRTEYLDRLTQFLDSHQGKSRATIIRGEPGSGKSRLAMEIVNQLEQRRSHWILHTKAVKDAPIAESLAVLCRLVLELQPTKLDCLEFMQRQALERLLPDQFPNTKNSQANTRNDSFHLQVALQNLFCHPDIPTLIVFDDLQWSDTPTLQHLVHVLEKNLDLCIIFTQRDTETSQADIEALLQWGAKNHSLEICKPNALNQTDLEYLTTQSKSQIWNANTLHRASGGNPLYALELLRSGQTSQGSSQVLELIRQRIRRIGTLERQALEGFAILGGRADLYTLQCVTGRSHGELIMATEQLEREGLLGQDNHDLQLNHDLTREAIEQDLGIARRATLHLRAARAYNKLPDIAAQHYWESRQVWLPRDRVYAHKAFESLANRYGLHGQLDVAMDWMGRKKWTVVSERQKIETLIEQIEWLMKFDQISKALEFMQNVKKLIQNVKIAEFNAQILYLEARLLIRNLNKIDEGKPFLDLAMTLIENLKDKKSKILKSDILTMLGYYHQAKNSLDDSLRFYKFGLKIRKKFAESKKIEESMNLIASIHYLKNNFQEAFTIWTNLLTIKEISGDFLTMTSILNNLTACCFQEANYKKADIFVKKSIKLSKKIQNKFNLVVAYENKSCILTNRKSYFKSYSFLKKAILLRKQNNFNVFDTNLCFNMAEILYFLGKYKRSNLYLRKFWKFVKSNKNINKDILISALLLEFDVKFKQKNYQSAKYFLNKASKIILSFTNNIFQEGIGLRYKQLEQAKA